MAHWSAASTDPIPARAGIGLRFPHHRHVLESGPDTAWFEVHPENYACGGAQVNALEKIRRDYPVSFHAVGLSLGGADPLDRAHLTRLKTLIERLQPGLVSDHLSWSRVDGTYLADLLPLPYAEEALDVVARNIDHVQDFLGRKILVENPSSYLQFAHATMREEEFLCELVRRTGCGILCDVNNIYVSACNHGWDAVAYLNALPPEAIGEIHLAGHCLSRLADGTDIRIDDHGSAVAPEVWALFAQAAARFGPVPTLIEWDTDIPDFAILEGEARVAQIVLDNRQESQHVRAA